jgi:hypothetical protein
MSYLEVSAVNEFFHWVSLPSLYIVNVNISDLVTTEPAIYPITKNTLMESNTKQLFLPIYFPKLDCLYACHQV